jgi:hypothetical protein
LWLLAADCKLLAQRKAQSQKNILFAAAFSGQQLAASSQQLLYITGALGSMPFGVVESPFVLEPTLW